MTDKNVLHSYRAVLQDALSAFCYIANNCGDTFGNAEHPNANDYNILAMCAKKAEAMADALADALKDAPTPESSRFDYKVAYEGLCQYIEQCPLTYEDAYATIKNVQRIVADRRDATKGSS